MREKYPEFVHKAYAMVGFENFGHIARDRWNTFEIDGYRKLSNVLKKSKDTSWEKLYVYYNDLYILVQYLANYDEKYNDLNNVTEEEFIKLMEKNLNNPYINWDRIYDYFGYEYNYNLDYLDKQQRIVLNVLFKFRKQFKFDKRLLRGNNVFW